MNNINAKVSTPLYKILILGDSNVGKTCLKKRYVDDIFSTQYNTTIGIDYKVKFINIENQLIKLSIWDTAGQEKYRAITKSYFANSNGILLCFDTTDRSTFEDLGYWFELITENIKGGVVFITLVGTKVDRKDRTVSYDEACRFAEGVGLKYFETSALRGFCVAEAFYNLATQIYKNEESMQSRLNQSLNRFEIGAEKGERKCCW
jgi:Ras-related protein Rab-1A